MVFVTNNLDFYTSCVSSLSVAEEITGILKRNVQTMMQSTPNIIATHHTELNTAKYTIDAPKQTSANNIAHIFTFFEGSALFSFHSSMIGPNTLEFVSQLRNLSEERAKQNAERSMKGVVGRPGKTTPTAPAARNNIPTVSHAARRKIGRCLL